MAALGESNVVMVGVVEYTGGGCSCIEHMGGGGGGDGDGGDGDGRGTCTASSNVTPSISEDTPQVGYTPRLQVALSVLSRTSIGTDIRLRVDITLQNRKCTRWLVTFCTTWCLFFFSNEISHLRSEEGVSFGWF
jgi:hypothetical protein